MVKSTLAVIFSLVFIAFSAPAALAQESAESTVSSQKPKAKKHSAKKNVAAKGNAKASAARGKLVKKVVMVKGKRKVVYQRVALVPAAPIVPAKPSAGDMAGLNQTQDPLNLMSNVALVVDQTTSQVLFEKNAQVALPIASITKLMTSLVVVESHQNMNDVLEVTEEDIDHEKNSASRLRIGSHLTRNDMLHIALMSSENRAASALGRNYPGGLTAFVSAMNAKAKSLGMLDTHYVDSTGLSSQNVASARDLAKLVNAVYQYPIIRQYSTDSSYMVETGGHQLQYSTSNRLVSNPGWEIGLQKTGYISEAGRCLVMQAMIDGRPVVMVFLDSKGKQSRLGDAGRIRKWLETAPQAGTVNRVAAHQG